MKRKFLYKDISVELPEGPAPTGMHFTVDEILERSANGLPIPTSYSGKEMSFEDYTEDEWEDMEYQAAKLDELKMQKLQDFYKNNNKNNNEENDTTDSNETDNSYSSEDDEGNQVEPSAK